MGVYTYIHCMGSKLLIDILLDEAVKGIFDIQIQNGYKA